MKQENKDRFRMMTLEEYHEAVELFVATNKPNKTRDVLNALFWAFTAGTAGLIAYCIL